ncbi:MAG: hypothetical protein HRT47_08225 [Candidatus Caenarcaniphilales bacterium]|nr:hypothetical protein [Candidatus Caenarcaniphilales bacterium]
MIFDEINSSNINAVKKSKLSPYKHDKASKSYIPKRHNLGEDSVDISEEAVALSEQKTINVTPEDIIE